MRRERVTHAALLAGMLAAAGCKGEPARANTPAPTASAPAPTPAPNAPEAAESAPEAAPSAPEAPARTLVQHEVFRVDLAPLPACMAGATCEARLVVHALGGYKVNAEYPTKFVGDAASTVALDGTGTFAIEAKARGVMTVRFRPSAAGTAHVSGALKLSVCTDEVCKIEAPQIAFEVPVS